MNLHQLLQQQAAAWAAEDFPCEAFPAVSEVLGYQLDENRISRFLRPPQIEALNVYWFLRVQQDTPRIVELYERTFPSKKDLLSALGLDTPAVRDFLLDHGSDLEALWSRIRTDDTFVAENKLNSVRETLALDYPSYILALAMGAGKTALIGAIIATEFALALEYNDRENPFIENALVFVPGITPLGSLRELATLPYERILPPRFHKFFAASVKLIFTRDGDPDIPVVRGDSFNVIVTNTEKIRIQKDTIRKSDLGALISEAKADEARSEVANRRLQAIASLPHLGVFSDEAHHTFGRSMENQLKRVRQTIDYLHRQSPNLICVVNTTGTPYLDRQPLRDVIVWYGLSEGIRHGILKQIGKIEGYSLNDEQAPAFVTAVIDDFFANYRDVALPSGAPAKIALYFPQVDDLRELRPVVEARLLALGLSTSLLLENTTQSPAADIAAFNRLNDPAAPHRVILLVNKGTEGWNCPSLFACALVRRLRTSNNFVLQAASRCLRQIPGNTHTATIYLTLDNKQTLERELRETYGETIAGLTDAQTRSRRATIRLRKLDLPPIVIRQTVRRIVRDTRSSAPIILTRPHDSEYPDGGTFEKRSFRIEEDAAAHQAPKNRGKQLLQQQGDTESLFATAATFDLHTAATELAATYRLDPLKVLADLRQIYPGLVLIPAAHLVALGAQIEAQAAGYHVVEEVQEIALALVKVAGFRRETDPSTGDVAYVAEISYPVSKEHLLLHWQQLAEKNPRDFGFHYTPYAFDSQPEFDYFRLMLEHLNVRPDEIADILFTGALVTPDKSDFAVGYRDTDGRWRHYTPDFVLRRKDGRHLIVEIKDSDSRGDAVNGEHGLKALALRQWENLNPDRLKYEMIFVGKELGHDQLRSSRDFADTPADAR